MPEPRQRMGCFRLLRNPIREYPWGSRTALAEVLGQPTPAPSPQAELWMGAHPTAPSEVCEGSRWVPLDDWIRRDAAAVLGAEVVRSFGEELPFLLKVLAVERPLSLQVHPGAAQARAGFERENAAGIALGARHRSYRDPNPKSELVCALTPFAALCGFRTIDEIVAQVDELRARRLADLMGPLRFERDRENLRGFCRALMTLDAAEATAAVAEAVDAAEGGYGDPEVRGWLRKLADAYPGDRGALSPLFLNLVELRPGEALFLPAGQIHTYLHGTAVEIMTNSDNVLRGGLTPKHVDVPALLGALRFDSRRPEVLTPRAQGPVEAVYDTSAREFALSVLRPHPERSFESGARGSVEILFCSSGEATLEGVERAGSGVLARGAAVVVPAAAGAYSLRGDATVYRATVPVAGVGAGSG